MDLITKPNFDIGSIFNRLKIIGPKNKNGIDRIDLDIGYIKGNIVPCCKPCNHAKLTMPLKYFVEWINNFSKYPIIEKDIMEYAKSLFKKEELGLNDNR